MSIYRPGGEELTRHALQLAGLHPGNELLDIGCGDGDAALLAQNEYGLKVTAVDIDKDAVARAASAGVNAREMDASALEFSSRCFDAVMMECVFSCLDRQEESLHEAWCMLRPGGVLMMSDVYCRAPDIERWQKDYREAMALFRRPREEGDCESGEKLPSPYCQDGAIVMDGLYGLLDELDMEVMVFEDRTGDLKAFIGQAIFDCGSLEAWFDSQGGWKNCECTRRGDLGYFLLIARKKNA